MLMVMKTIEKSITVIKPEQANDIIEYRNPVGLFIFEEDNCWIGINNCKCEAVTQGFEDKKDCIKWLYGGAQNV